MISMRVFLALVFCFLLSIPTNAHDYKVGDLVIAHAVIPATLPGAPVAAGYLEIKNHGDTADRLIAVSAEFSGKQELHTMKMEDGVMKMRPLENGIEIPAGGHIVLKKGGNHIMFMKLSEPMNVDEKREAVLEFEKAGKVTVQLNVIDPAKLKSDDMKMDHSEHSH